MSDDAVRRDSRQEMKTMVLRLANELLDDSDDDEEDVGHRSTIYRTLLRARFSVSDLRAYPAIWRQVHSLPIVRAVAIVPSVQRRIVHAISCDPPTISTAPRPAVFFPIKHKTILTHTHEVLAVLRNEDSPTSVHTPYW